jgi:hypothetical protein
MLRLLTLEGFYASDELAALWLIVVENYPQPIDAAAESSEAWQAAIAEVQTALDEAAGREGK